MQRQRQGKAQVGPLTGACSCEGPVNDLTGDQRSVVPLARAVAPLPPSWHALLPKEAAARARLVEVQGDSPLLKLEVDEQTKELSNKESLRMELESLQKQHGVQTNRQQDLLNELSKAKDTIADSVPFQDFMAVKSKLDELLEQIDRANKKEGVAVGVEGILTPRPDWKSLFFGHEGLAEGLAPPSGARPLPPTARPPLRAPELRRRPPRRPPSCRPYLRFQ